MIGVDVGYGYTKAYPGEVVFPSIVGNFRERRLKSEGDYMDNLEVEVNGEKYFVGNLARREGGSSPFDKNKTNHAINKVCLLTAIALCKTEKYISETVVTGLPVSDMAQRNQLTESLKGIYTVKTPDKWQSIEIAEVLVFPQAGAAFFDLLLNEQGKAQAGYEGKIGILDIGEKTVDFCVLEGICYQDKLSNSLPLGMFQANKMIFDELKKDYDLLLHEIPNYVKRKPMVAEKHYKELAQQIKDGVSAWWYNMDFDKIYIAGGGGEALFSYLKDYFPCELATHSQLANARGYYKCGIARG